LATDGAIEDAVLAMLRARKKAMASGLPPAEEWSVRVAMSDEVGYELFVKERIFAAYAEKDATEPMIVKSLVTFIFGLIEEDLAEIQVRSTTIN
jgi:hypothetical protein